MKTIKILLRSFLGVILGIVAWIIFSPFVKGPVKLVLYKFCFQPEIEAKFCPYIYPLGEIYYPLSCLFIFLIIGLIIGAFFEQIKKYPKLLLVIIPLIIILGAGFKGTECGSGCLGEGFYGFFLDFGFLGPTYTPDFIISDFLCPAICTTQYWYQLHIDWLLIYFLYLFLVRKKFLPQKALRIGS